MTFQRTLRPIKEELSERCPRHGVVNRVFAFDTAGPYFACVLCRFDSAEGHATQILLSPMSDQSLSPEATHILVRAVIHMKGGELTPDQKAQAETQMMRNFTGLPLKPFWSGTWEAREAAEK